MHVCSVASVKSNSLWPRGLQPARLFHPWDSPDKKWSGLPCPPPGDLPDPGIEPGSPVLQTYSLLLSHQGSPSFPESPEKVLNFIGVEWALSDHPWTNHGGQRCGRNHWWKQWEPIPISKHGAQLFWPHMPQSVGGSPNSVHCYLQRVAGWRGESKLHKSFTTLTFSVAPLKVLLFSLPQAAPLPSSQTSSSMPSSAPLLTILTLGYLRCPLSPVTSACFSPSTYITTYAAVSS